MIKAVAIQYHHMEYMKSQKSKPHGYYQLFHLHPPLTYSPGDLCWIDPLKVSSICIVPLDTTDSAAERRELSLPNIN